MMVEKHPWIRALLYLSFSLLTLTVSTYILVTTRLVYQQGYQIIDLHRQLEQIKAEQGTDHASKEKRLDELEAIVLMHVPGIVKSAAQSSDRAAIVQSWQRNAYLGLDRRISTLERWRYSCNCGVSEHPYFSNLLTQSMRELLEKNPMNPNPVIERK